MSAGVYNLVIEQGATFVEPFTWRVDDGSSPPSGPIVDVTGCTARMQIRDNIAAITPLFELNTTNGMILLTGGSIEGNIQLQVDAVTTAGFAFSTAIYDLEIITASGFVTRLLKGTVTVDPEVTR